jgi:hypothetical protein
MSMSMSVSMPHDGDVAVGVLGMESIGGCTGRVCTGRWCWCRGGGEGEDAGRRSSLGTRVAVAEMRVLNDMHPCFLILSDYMTAYQGRKKRQRNDTQIATADAPGGG